MSAPRYVVIRPAPDLPPGFLPPDRDGWWYDADDLPYGTIDDMVTLHGGGGVAVATGRYETREDGAVAEVYEVRP